MKPVYKPLEDITYDEALTMLESGTIEEEFSCHSEQEKQWLIGNMHRQSAINRLSPMI